MDEGPLPWMKDDDEGMDMIDRTLNYGRHIIEEFLREASPFRTVLDIGAGRGDDLLLAGRINPEAELCAIEVCPEYSRDLSGRNIKVHSVDIERDVFPFPDARVDVVVMNQVLEHTKEIFWIFHEVSRILALSGKVIIGVPNLAALHNRILLLFGRQPSPLKSHSAHVRGFTRGDILRFVESCFPGGYRLKAFRGSNFYPFPPQVARPLAAMFPGMAWGIFFLLEKQKDYRREFLDFPVEQRLETNFYLGRE